MVKSDLDDRGRQPAQRERSARRPYVKPKVIDRGQLVEVALGGSPGTGDSGGGALVENPIT